MRTRITEMLGIEYPIFQGGMAWVSEPCLAGAVSNAGGLGIIVGSYYTPEELAAKIAEVKQITNRPFAVNFTPTCEHLEANLEVCVGEKVAAVTYGRGRHTTDVVIATLKPHGIRCIPVVGALRQALRVEEEGADAIVVSGFEAGGHVSRVGTMALLPLAARHLKVPIVAAGGFGDGRGLAAALAMGASGIQMGTRFVCTKESPAHPVIKRRMLGAKEDDTLVTGHVTGLRCRVLKNRLTDQFLDLEDRKAPPAAFDKAGIGKGRAAFVDGDEEEGSIWCGQVIGLVEDEPTCRELIERMVREARQASRELQAVFAGP